MNLCINADRLYERNAASIRVLVWVCMVLMFPMPSYAEEQTPAAVKEARQAVMTFQKALKKELMSAMQLGGPKKAVEVCHSRAPEIAAEIGGQTGWQISRTSLKARNVNNIPDEAELSILKQFEERKNNGETVSELEWWKEDETAIAYMKAIPMKGMCINCHGKAVSPSLKNHINQFYPNDMATGFELGDIRGAFSLKKYLQGLGSNDTSR